MHNSWPMPHHCDASDAVTMVHCCIVQLEQQKYEGRILALQRAKQEAVSKAKQERSRAHDLEQQVEQVNAEKHK